MIFTIYTKIFNILKRLILVINLIPSGGYISLRANLKKSNNSKIDLGNNIRLYRFSEIESFYQGKIQIGNNFTLNPFSRIIAGHKIVIGNNVTIARYVTILDHDHNFTPNRGVIKGYKLDEVYIGSHVLICDKVTILKGVSICDNVIIGANSIVTKNISIPGTYGGSPLRLIKKHLI